MTYKTSKKEITELRVLHAMLQIFFKIKIMFLSFYKYYFENYCAFIPKENEKWKP